MMPSSQPESSMNLSQQAKIINPHAVRKVTLIGAGSVGSHVAVMLAKMGVLELTVYDHDSVESHNIPMSEYRQTQDLMRPKVHALADIIRVATDQEIDARYKPYEGEPLAGAVVCCVDTMEARQLVWKKVREHRGVVEVLVDTRISNLLIEVFAVNPNDHEDVELYEYYLRYSTKEAAPPMCGQHTTKFIASKTAAIACENLTCLWQHGRKKLAHRETAVELVPL